jgi:hypothetical protein
MSTQPVYNLELRAVEQRRQIHVIAQELKGKISQAKQRLDVTRNLREHLFAVAMAFGVVTLVVGTLIARRFKQ